MSMIARQQSSVAEQAIAYDNVRLQIIMLAAWCDVTHMHACAAASAKVPKAEGTTRENTTHDVPNQVTVRSPDHGWAHAGHTWSCFWIATQLAAAGRSLGSQ